MWYRIKSALKYYLFSRHRKGHAIHSPFVFDLITKVFLDTNDYPEYKIIEQQIKRLKKSKLIVKTPIYGAKQSDIDKFIKIKNIIKSSTINPRYGRLLFRMVRYFKAQYLLELGSGLGIGSSYLALANKNGKLWTIEASEKYVEIAKEITNACNIDNIDIIQGTFEDKLNLVLNSMPSLDFVFIDGNHTYMATIKYFEQILSKVNNQSVIVIDDIHWSKEMYEAWKEIKKNERVTLTIDIYRMGFVFVKKEIMAKQHFTIRF
ncbi:MAG: O-methyltransferase [Bacteroidales bacterium]